MCILTATDVVSIALKIHKSKLSDILALRGFIIRPLCENTLSTGAELAGMEEILENSDLKQLYSGSVQILDEI